MARRKITTIANSVIIFSTLILATSVTAGSGDSFPASVSFGMYTEQLDRPIIYESFVPLVYEFQVPQWEKLDITLRDWRTKCTSDSFTPSYSCVVFYHYEKFLERLEDDLVAKQPKPSMNRLMDEQPSTDTCHNIKSKFEGTTSSQRSFYQYIDVLRNCPLGDYIEKKRTIFQDFAYVIKDIYKTMISRYEAEFSNKVSQTDRMGPAYYVNALTAHQNTMIINYITEKLRWVQASSTCSLSHGIPDGIVRTSNLTSALTGLVTKLKSENRFTLSVPIEALSTYYKLPLADCVLMEKTFGLRIAVPVKSPSFQPKLIEIKVAPFVKSEPLTRTMKLCQVTETVQGTYLYDETTGFLEKTTCQPGSLCRVDTLQPNVLSNLCVRAYLSKSWRDIKGFCPFGCISVPMEFNSDDEPMAKQVGILPKLPIISRLTSNTILVTGPITGPVRERCSDKDSVEDFANIKHGLFAAVEFRLRCNCVLEVESNRYEFLGSCNSTTASSLLIPIFWVKNERLEEGLPIGKPIHFNENMLEDSSTTTTTSGTWSGTTSSTNRIGGSSTTLSPTENLPRAAATGSETATGGGTTVLWVFFILQTIVFFCVILALAWKYRLYRNQMGYSKERLVYNIHGSESNLPQQE